MKSRNWKSASLIAATALVVVAILLSALAWCFSDPGLSWIQRNSMRNFGNLTWRPISLTYSDDWIVETVSRPEDGAVLVYGLWTSGKTVPSMSASLGLKRRITGQRVYFMISRMAPDMARSGNYDECLRSARCRAKQSFLGLNTPNVVVPVDGGEWVVFEHLATSILVLNPKHADLSGIHLQPMNSSFN